MENICTFSEETHTISCPMRFKHKSILLCITLILLVVAGSGTYLYWSLNTKKQTVQREINGHLQTLATGHAATISTWINGLITQGKRLTDSDMFRLYTASVDSLGGDISGLVLPESKNRDPEEISEITAQQAMMQKMLEDFTTFSGFLSARVTDRNGAPFLATPQTQPPLSAVQKELIRAAATLSKPLYSPLRKGEACLAMDIFLPVSSLAAGSKPRTVGVFMFTVNAMAQVNDILFLDSGRKQGERTLLIDKTNNTYRSVRPWLPQKFTPLQTTLPLNELQALDFRQMTSLAGKTKVYALGKNIPELHWWIIEEIDVKVANQGLRQSMFREIVISILMTLISCLAMVLVWWWILERERQGIAREFKNLADENARQKHFLDSINTTVPELIGLKNNAGEYVYINQAFAVATGRKTGEIHGMDDEALFGFDTGRRLLESDHQAMAEDGVISSKETIFLQSKKHIFQISKVPFRDEHNSRTGILCVYRDITEEAENEKQARRRVAQTTQALVKAIEMTDPYLAGHSELLKKLAEALGNQLGLEEKDKKTVEIAATLSQIGKLFVDKDLLNKPGKLTPEERWEIERHVEHAAAILEDISFNLPVRETILQSNEFLDGSGYPKGLTGEQITLPARLICCLNTFCALIRPRSYRSAMNVQEAIDILEKNSNQYDQQVVKGLKEIVPELESLGIISEKNNP